MRPCSSEFVHYEIMMWETRVVDLCCFLCSWNGRRVSWRQRKSRTKTSKHCRKTTTNLGGTMIVSQRILNRYLIKLKLKKNF